MFYVILQLWIAIIIGAIATLFILKARSAGKQNIIMIHPNHTYSTGEYAIDGNRLKLKKHFKPKFTSLDFLEERKARWKFWRNPKRLLFFLENTMNALSFFDYDDDGKLKAPCLTDKFGWTPDEVNDYNKKMAKQAALESRPFSQMMFYVLVALTAGSLLFSFLIALRIGAF